MYLCIYVFINLFQSSVVIGAELAKISLSLCSPEFYKTVINVSLGDSLYWALFPAVLFAGQNFLNYRGLEYTNAVTFNLLNQLKILSAAFFNWMLIPNKKFSLMQLFSLALLALVAFLLSVANSNSSVANSNSTGNLREQLVGDMYCVGVGYVLLAATISGLAGTLSQKGQKTRSTNVYTVELGVYGIITVLLKDIYDALYSSGSVWAYFVNLFSNWSVYTCIPVLTAGIGGILVGKVTAALGAVEKGMSLIGRTRVAGTVPYRFW